MAHPTPAGGEIACPYCQAPSSWQFSAPDYNRKASRVVFHVNRCEACGLLFVTNPPEDLGKYYTSDYHYIPDTAEELEAHLPMQQFKVDILRRFKAGGTLLEIGPGIGSFCRLAQRAGFQVSAIEMDVNCAGFLRDKLGVRTINSDDPAGALAQDPTCYDAICLWHSIEHMKKPWEVLDRAIDRLSDDGILLVAAPNPLSWQARLLKARWPHHDLPRHLFGLPIPWLVSYAQKHGLTTEWVTTRDEGSLFWNRFTWAMLAKSLSSKQKPGGSYWRWGLRFGRLLQPWEGLEGKGATYTAVFRKPRADTAPSQSA